MSGVYGADVATAVTTEQWRLLMSQNDVSFCVVRCYESVGQLDANAPATVNNAWAAGISSVDVYHFPCLSVGATEQVQASVNALRAENAQFGRFWFDVEQGAGWSSTDFDANADFLAQLIAAAEALGLVVGIYTSIGEWSSIIQGTTAFSRYPLWYSHYEDPPNPSFSDLEFRTFGGWTQAFMKQFIGNQITSSGVEIDGNWAPALVSASKIGSKGSNGSAVPAPSKETTDIRAAVTKFASSIAGTSAAMHRAKYLCIIAPGETTSTQASMATVSSCGLTVAGIWRGCGYYGRPLNAPYVIGTAISRLYAIGSTADAWVPYSPGALPSPGDMVLIGGSHDEHVYTVISVGTDGDGNSVLQTVDGGYPSGGIGPGSQCDAIAASTHWWSNGLDSDKYVPNRAIQGWIDVTKVLQPARSPLYGFVQAASPSTMGFDTAAPVNAAAAAALLASGYRFCIRYVSLDNRSTAGLSSAEAQAILGAGLGLMLAQRVDATALTFSASLGNEHGEAAAASAVAIGLPMCVNLWLRLDNIPASAPSQSLIAYYNGWYAAVYDAGFLPGLRVGRANVLNAWELGESNAFSHYWQASGTTVSPSPRGYQLVEGMTQTIVGLRGSVNTTQNDAEASQAQWLIVDPK